MLGGVVKHAYKWSSRSLQSNGAGSKTNEKEMKQYCLHYCLSMPHTYTLPGSWVSVKAQSYGSGQEGHVKGRRQLSCEAKTKELSRRSSKNGNMAGAWETDYQWSFRLEGLWDSILVRGLRIGRTPFLAEIKAAQPSSFPSNTWRRERWKTKSRNGLASIRPKVERAMQFKTTSGLPGQALP